MPWYARQFRGFLGDNVEQEQRIVEGLQVVDMAY